MCVCVSVAYITVSHTEPGVLDVSVHDAVLRNMNN